MKAWWEKPDSPESRRFQVGCWEFYRDRRDWWIGVFFAGERGTYFAFLTLVAKRAAG